MHFSPLSQRLSPSLWRKSAGVTAKAAHAHSHADRQEASTNPKEDFSHPPLLLPPPASLYCLPLTHLHTSGAAVSWPAQAFPADHTMRKIRNWPMKSIRRNVVLLWIVGIHRLAHLREKEKQIAVTRSVCISVLVIISAACAVTLGCLGCGLSLKDTVMVNQTWVVFILTKSL